MEDKITMILAVCCLFCSIIAGLESTGMESVFFLVIALQGIYIVMLKNGWY